MAVGNRLKKSRLEAVKKNAEVLERLSQAAEILGYKVRFIRIKEMQELGLEGWLCPDIGIIYVSPQENVVETLAHEVGHALLESMYSMEFDLSLKHPKEEDLVDILGWAMLEWLGVQAPNLKNSLKKIS